MKSKKISLAERANGRRQVKIHGKTHHEDVHEQMGSDGVIETHITYKKTEPNYYGRAHSIRCGKCGVWVLERHVAKPHGKECQ